MKIKKILNYLTLFIAFILIFGLVLACGEVSTKPEKVEKLTEEATSIEEDTEAVIEEDIEADIEEDTEADIEKTYKSEIKLISLTMSDSVKKLGQAASDCGDGKISIPEHKAITKKYIEEVKACYDMYLELKPSKRLEKAHDFFGKGMDHTLKSTTFLQRYIDTDNMEKMAGYLRQSNAEMDLATEYLLKATEQIKK